MHSAKQNPFIAFTIVLYSTSSRTFYTLFSLHSKFEVVPAVVLVVTTHTSATPSKANSKWYPKSIILWLVKVDGGTDDGRTAINQ